MKDRKVEYPFRTYHLWDKKTDKVANIKEVYLEDFHNPTICGEHIVLANLIDEHVKDPKVRAILLEQNDIVYDMGKRMGNKLQDYHKKFTNGKHGWREGF